MLHIRVTSAPGFLFVRKYYRCTLIPKLAISVPRHAFSDDARCNVSGKRREKA
jgi:hypothetical protein